MNFYGINDNIKRKSKPESRFWAGDRAKVLDSLWFKLRKELCLVNDYFKTFLVFNHYYQNILCTNFSLIYE